MSYTSMKNFLNLKMFLQRCSFCNSEDQSPIHFFYSCNQTKSLWSKFQELLNSKILLPQNMLQSAFFGFTDIKEILKSLAICILNLSIIYLNSNTKKK